MADEMDTDSAWNSNSTARQIQELGNVEKDIIRLLSLASSSMSLLALPPADNPNDALPEGDERSEQFVSEVTHYFETLDAIQISLRAVLAQLRRARISPSSIDASPANFIPPITGVGSPNAFDDELLKESKPLQEVRVERDAWKGVLDALQKIRRVKTSID